MWRKSTNIAQQHGIPKEQMLNWNYLSAEDQDPFYTYAKNNSRSNPYSGKNRILAYAVTLAWEGRNNDS